MNPFKLFISYIFIFILITNSLAQLKEFEVKREPPPESIPIFTNNPNEAAIIIYSSITNLYFESNMDGIVDDKSKPDEGKYTLLIRPIKQILTVKAKDYREGKFRIPNMEPREVLYYSIESKHGKGDFVLKTNPPGATLHIDGLPDFEGKTPFTFVDYIAQPYKIKIIKEGFEPLDTAITIEKGRVLTETFELTPIQIKEVVPTVISGQADLSIESDPSGGVVYLDGDTLDMVTPCNIRDLSSGKHRIKIEKGNLIAEEQVILEAGKLNKLSLTLKEKIYTIIIYSNPENAIVKVSDKTLGYTPLEYSYKESDLPVEISVIKEGYLPYTKRIESGGDTFSRLDAKLERYGAIQINTVPRDARVFINGEYKSNTPFRSGLMKLGNYELELRKENYETVSLKVELSGDKAFKLISENLSQLYGEISLATIPDGASVFIDYNKIDYVSDQNVKIAFGNHQLKAKRKGYLTYNEDLIINSSEPFTKNIQLEPKSKGKARLMSVLIPGTGQMYYGTVEKGLIFTGISLGLAYSAFFYNDSFSKSWDQFNIDLENYRNAETISEIVRTKKIKNDSYAKAIQERNITLGSAGLLGFVWLYNIWDSGRNFKHLQKDIEVSLNKPNTVQFSYKF
ncbi:PEGA domain-containing protein [bacterium]|nr:PEGA domain-containing protein [bacterium]